MPLLDEISHPVSAEQDHNAGEKKTPSSTLFPFEDILEATDRVLNLALYLVGLAL